MTTPELRYCRTCHIAPKSQFFMMTLDEVDAIVRYRIKCPKCRRATPWRGSYFECRELWNARDKPEQISLPAAKKNPKWKSGASKG